MERKQESTYDERQSQYMLNTLSKTRDRLGFKKLVGDTSATLWVYEPEDKDSWLNSGCGSLYRNYVEKFVNLAGLRLPTYAESILILMNDETLKREFILKIFEVARDEKFNNLNYNNTLNQEGEFVKLDRPNLQTPEEILERSVEVLHGSDPLRLAIYGYAKEGTQRFHLDTTNNHGGHQVIVGVLKDWKMDKSLEYRLLRKEKVII